MAGDFYFKTMEKKSKIKIHTNLSNFIKENTCHSFGEKCVPSINKNNRMEFVRLRGSILSSLFSGLTPLIFVYSDYWKTFFKTIYVEKGTTRSHQYYNSFMKNSTFRSQEIIRSL